MIQVKDVSFKYETAKNGTAVTDINITIPNGEIVLLCGESGSGKTTFSRLLNGLIPSYYEGDLNGTVYVFEKNTSEAQLYELAPHVGSVFQNPKSQFYTLLTDTEIVFACENIGLCKDDILTRFDNTVKSLNIENLVGKSLFALSGGEKQKIAIASVDTLLPDVFVLDEPTSNLDIKAIQDMQNILSVWKKQGKTVIIAEHRLSWLRDIADRVLYFKDGKIAEDLSAELFFKKPLSMLHNMGLRASPTFEPKKTSNHSGEYLMTIEGFEYSINNAKILDIQRLQIPKGSVVAVLGNNGAGKTTFVRVLCGLLKKAKGRLIFNDKTCTYKQRLALCYMVMQDVNHQLFSESVTEEVLLGLDVAGESERNMIADDMLSSLDLLEYKDAHPLSLSGGQRQRVAIAGAIATHKEIIVFDEPTSGLDYRHMKDVAQSIEKLSDMGKTQFIITHDPELVRECCDYFIYMESGIITQSGSWSEENIRHVSEYFDKI